MPQPRGRSETATRRGTADLPPSRPAPPSFDPMESEPVSRVTELAEREAAAAEAEPEPGEPGEPTEPSEPEPSEPEPETAAKIQAAEDAQLRAFTRHMDAHKRKLRQIMGDDFEAFEPCGFCEGIGYRVIGAPQAHPESERCEACGGHGFLLTGSENPAYASIACDHCQGQGYRMKLPELPPVPVGQPTTIYIDPATGLQVAAPYTATPPPPNGTWAPGAVMPAQPLPQPPSQP